MKEMTIDEIKVCSLSILDFFDGICRENSIRYFLCGGTLLGAIRHKGFIPWDDDIDVMMPRKDYEHLFEVWPSDTPIKLMNHKNTRCFPYSYGKAIDNRTVKVEPVRKDCQHIGVDIDIFPIDNIPDNNKETEYFFDGIARYQKRLYLQIVPYSKSTNLLKTIAKCLRIFVFRSFEVLGITSVDRIVSGFSRFAQKYDKDDTSYCGITTISHYGIREKNSKNTFKEAVYVSFEGKDYPAPVGFASYLKRLYGDDYMSLPPAEMQFTHHGYKAYWK